MDTNLAPMTKQATNPGPALGGRSARAGRRSAMVGALPVYEDADLRIAILEGARESMVIVFTGLGQGMGPARAQEFAGSASGDGRNTVVFVVDKNSGWYEQPGLARRISMELGALVAERKPERILNIGNSMGGYGAIRFSAVTGAQTVLAFGPQYSIKPGVVPGETRWTRAAARIGEISVERLDGFFCRDATYVITHGLNGLDRLQAAMFPTGRRIDHYLFAERDHDTGGAIKLAGMLPRLLRAAVNGRRRRMGKLIVAAGGIPRSERDAGGIDGPRGSATTMTGRPASAGGCEI